jgi:hypothetical protein
MSWRDGDLLIMFGAQPEPVRSSSLGGFAPQAPQDLSQFSSRVDDFCWSVLGNRRTMEELDRRIGQRRDATRAPTQARSGWRPSGRLLGSLPRPSRNGGAPAESTGDPFALRANGNMGPSKSRIVNHGFESLRPKG